MQTEASARFQSNPRTTLLRENVLDMRAKWRDTMNNLAISLDQFADSKSRFMTAFQNAMVSNQAFQSSRYLEVMFDKLSKDECALRHWIADTQRIEPELSQLEHILLESDRQNSSEIQEQLHTTSTENRDPDSGSQNRGSDGGITNEVPEAVSDYFDAVGDTRLMIAKLQDDLPAEYEEELAERQRKVSQELPLDLSDEAFQERWASRVQTARDELLVLERRTQRLLDICTSQGLNADPGAYTRKSESAVSSSVSAGEAVQDWLQYLPSPSRVSSQGDVRSLSLDRENGA